MDRDVFLKILNPALTADPEIRARFEREARAAAKLDHPNLVRVHEFGEDKDEGLFMVLEWVTGRTLRDCLDSGQKFSQQEISSIAGQLFASLQALHAAGIQHRDVKPENILLTDTGVVRITDFSLAALQGAVKLTHHQAIVGTPAYMSPEQAAGSQPDERSDLFSAGIVLLELASGDNPFTSDDMLETLRRIREKDITSELSKLSALPPDLVYLIRSCLQKTPADRPRNAAAALKLLNSSSEGEVNYSAARREFRTPIIVGSLIALLLIFVGYWKFGPDDMTDESTNLATAVTDSIEAQTEPVELDKPSADSLEDETVSGSESTIDPVVEQRQPEIIAGMKPTSPPNTEKEETIPHDYETLQVAELDSMDCLLTTDPWAHINTNGHRFGTTPLGKALRLPAGENQLSLHNSAFPPVFVEFNLTDSTHEFHFDLRKYVTTLDIQISPWGEIYIDDEHAGTAPLSFPLLVSPGDHKLKITHPMLPSMTRPMTASAGDSILVTVDLNTSELAIRAAGATTP